MCGRQKGKSNRKEGRVHGSFECTAVAHLIAMACVSPLPALTRAGKNRKDKKPLPMKVCTSIIDGLKQIYFQKVSGAAGRWPHVMAAARTRSLLCNRRSSGRECLRAAVELICAW